MVDRVQCGAVVLVAAVALSLLTPAGGASAAPSRSSRPPAGGVTGSTRSGEDLPELGAISGSVVSDLDGEPVAGVCVSAIGDESAPQFGETDESGGYVLGGLASGDYTVHFDRCGASTDGDDPGLIVPPSRQVTVEAPGSVDGVDARLIEEMDEPATQSDGFTSASVTGEDLPEVGAISGSVVSGVDGEPVAGVCVSAVGDERPPAFGVTDESGGYVLGGLASGDYSVQFDRCGASSDGDDSGLIVPPSRQVTVAAPAVVDGVDARLIEGTDEPAPQSDGFTSASQDGHITGTVTADAGGAPLGGICVSAYEPATDDYGSATTGPGGTYDIGGLHTGSYKVRFYDCSGGGYAREYFDDTYSYGSAALVAVTAGQTTAGIDAGLAVGGHIAGTVTADAGGAPLGAICVYTEDPDTYVYGSATTGPDGTYDIGGLPTGSYTVYFYDCGSGGYLSEYFDGAALVAVAVGQTTSGIDAGLADGGHIAGTVTADAGGAPLADICASAYDPAIDHYGSATTGPDGTYDIGSLPTGSYTVSFSDCSGGEYVSEYFDDTYSYQAATSVAVTLGQITSGIDAGLAVGGHIDGTVTADAGGAPLADICVYAYDPATHAESYGSTGPDGTYDIDRLPTGSYRVRFSDCSGGDYLSEYFDDTHSSGSAALVAVTLGQTTSGIDAGLAAGGHITGTVTADAGAAPLSDLCVYAHDPATDVDGYGYTGPDGTYDIDRLPTGSYRVWFSDCSGGDYLSEYFDDTYSYQAATLVAVTLGQTTSGIDAGLAVGGHIAGTVTADAGGAPLADICVSAYDPDTDASGSRRTATDGTYDIGRLPTGSYRVRFSDCSGGDYLSEYFDDTYSYQAATLVAVTLGQTTSGIDAGLAVGGHIAGTVTADAGGVPLADICVSAYDPATDAEGYGSTGPDGTYDIGRLPTGSYKVAFSDCGGGGSLSEYFDDTHSYGSATPVAVTAGQTTSGIDAGLATGGHITGTVTADTDGAPLADICVSAYDPATDAESYGQTGPDGIYDLDGLPTGSYRVRFSDCSGGGYLSEYFDDTRSSGSAALVAVTAGQTTSGIDAGLAAGGRIAGTVTEAASGQPVPYAGVAVLRTSDFSLAGAAVADPSGDFWVQVPPGTYYLYLLDGSGRHADGFFGPPTVVTVTAGSFTDANPTMAPTRGTIAGTVTDTGTPTPTPLAGVRAITINTATGALERAALSGAGGNYTIGDVPVGSYWVVFLDPTGNHAARYGLSAPTVATASTASVAAGASAALHAALPAQSPPPAGSSITGTVTETGTGSAMSGVVVVALRTSDYGLARTATTNANGTYTLDVAPGNYHLAFLDATGTHTSEWFLNQPISNFAGAATVAAPSISADAGLASTTGAFTGTVTAQANGAAIPDAWVIAINTNGQITRSTVTAANGTYTLAGLAPGNYRAVVVDPTGTHPVRYYPASVDYAGATAIAVTPANNTTGINLALPSN